MNIYHDQTDVDETKSILSNVSCAKVFKYRTGFFCCHHLSASGYNIEMANAKVAISQETLTFGT